MKLFRVLYVVTLIVIIISSFVLIQSFLSILNRQPPPMPPEEWTLIAQAISDPDCQGVEQINQVFTGIRDDTLFFKAVWNESRQDLLGIFWKDEYECTFTGSEGTVYMNRSYVEGRYLHVLMESTGVDFEFVCKQLPHIDAWTLFTWNLEWVYTEGGEDEVVVGVIPSLPPPTVPIAVEDLEVVTVQSGFSLISHFSVYITDNIPEATSYPTIDGDAVEWNNLERFNVSFALNPSQPALAMHTFCLSRQQNTLSLMFQINENYSQMLTHYSAADTVSLFEVLFSASGPTGQESYSIYFHADQEAGIIQSTGSIFHLWTDETGEHQTRFNLQPTDYALNNTLEATLPESVWYDLKATGASAIHINPDIQIAYIWPLTLL